MGDRTRILPRFSPRALTLCHLDTRMLGALGDVSGLRMLDGPNRASAQSVQKAGTSSNRTKASKGQISTHTQPTTPFPSGCSLLMHIQDDWCGTIKASPCRRAWLGLPRIKLDRLDRGCWLVSYTRGHSAISQGRLKADLCKHTEKVRPTKRYPCWRGLVVGILAVL